MQRKAPIILFAALLFVASLVLCTRENDFPFFYHPDESSKVKQLQTLEWNYHHPMLLLRTTQALNEATGVRENAQEVCEQGRVVSAVFTAGATSLLAATVWITFGSYAGVVAGLLLLTNHQLFELAHYLKEDPSLLFGIAAWLFGLMLYWRTPGRATAAVLGVGAALALSGKYLGAFAPLLTLGLVPFHAPQGRKLSTTLSFLLPLVATFTAINLPLVLHYSEFRASFDREVDLAVHGHRGITRSVPHPVYLYAFRDNINYLLWLPILWFYGVYCRRERLTGFQWTLALFPVVYLVVLSFIPKENDRYFLPANALFLCTAAVGLGDFCATLAGRHANGKPVLPAALLRWLRSLTNRGSRLFWQCSLPAILALVAVAAQLPGLLRYYRAFQVDDLARLTAWLNENLPNATLAIDRRVMLPSPRRSEFAPYQTPIKATTLYKTVEKFDTIEEMRAEGVTHVILSEQTYGRYFRSSYHPKKENAEEFGQTRALYEALLKEGDKHRKPLWKAGRGTVIYLHPGLEVYELPRP